MRYEAQVTALSWIPSEAVSGSMRVPFDVGVAHYDEPPPEQLGDGVATLEALRKADRFRFANVLRAWVEVDANGVITRSGYSGGSVIGATTMHVGSASRTFEAVPLPDIQREPEVLDGGRAVRFVQTGGGRTGVPAPRRVRRKPFIQWAAPLAWSTLALTLRADGSSSFEVVGASPFPRHWVYDERHNLAAKSGLIDFKDWYRKAFGKHSPWGDEDSPALVTAVETALERALSARLMAGAAKPKIRKVKKGAVIAEEGAPSSDLFLLLDGVIRAEKGGERLAEYGPGALLGERSSLEGGWRTATLVAVTPCRVAVAAATDVDRDSLQEVSQGHRHEEKR
ncbi:MAG: hypothetical protein QOE63_1858 [Acidimicrobiaceae bacterium]